MDEAIKAELVNYVAKAGLSRMADRFMLRGTSTV